MRDQRWFRGVPLIHSHSHPINPFSIHEITVYSFSYFHFTFSFCVHLIHSPEISVLNVYFSAQDQNFITEWCWRWVGWSDFLQADRQRAKQRRGKNSLKAGPHKKHPHFVGKGAQKAASRSLTVALTVVHSHSLPPPLIPGGCSGSVAACVRGSPQIPTKLGQNETIPRRQNRENWEEAGLTQNSTQQQSVDHGRPFVLRH